MSEGAGASIADEWLQIARKDWRGIERNLNSHVIPANPGEGRGRAGIQGIVGTLDSRFRGNDTGGTLTSLWNF